MKFEDDLPPPWRPGRRSPAWLLKRPLTWLIAGECVLMLALFAVAWHVYQGRPHAPGSVASLPSAPPGQPDPSPQYVPGRGATPAVAAPHPGLATDPATWIAQFEFINRD